MRSTGAKRFASILPQGTSRRRVLAARMMLALSVATIGLESVSAADAQVASSSNKAATDSPHSNTAPFNIIPIVTNSFLPGNATLPGFPQVALVQPGGSTIMADSVGYQDGAFVNGEAIYYPWEVINGGADWQQVIMDGVLNSVIISYNASGGVGGFSDPSNWSWFDLSTLPYAGKGTIQPGNQGYNTPAPYTGGVVVGNVVYPTPDANNPYPVFIAYNSSQPLDSPDAYQTFVPPPMGGARGPSYGWCSGTNDGRFVYYAPSSNPVNGNSGNIFRYDTTVPFSEISSWSNFDLGANISPDAEGFQSAAYDGHRFVYFIPFKNSLIVRYDSWGGGSAPAPAAFTAPASYQTLDPTLLNTPGYPSTTGSGKTANLTGFTGAAVAWDTAGTNEYLYFVPWGTYPANAAGKKAKNPHLESTTARVRIGTQNKSGWNYVDFTSTSSSPATDPDWEIYDLKSLTQNPAWPAAWPATYPSTLGTPFGGQSTIAGWQIAYVVTSPTSMVGFIPDLAEFFVQHSVDHALSDPGGWYVAQVPLCCSVTPPTLCPDTGYHCGTMGGGYDQVNQILYPSSPANPLFAIQFSPLPQ